MNNIDSIIAEVNSDLSKYADAHLLDQDSMYRDIILGIKKFGNDVTELQETVVEVENYKASLPDGFYNLLLAALCTPMNYETTTEDVDALQSSFFYTEKTRYDYKWNQEDACCVEKTESIIKENLYFRGSKIAEFRYGNPRLLTLGKSFQKNACHAKCRNKIIRDEPNEITIHKTTLQANFKEGSIYMLYYGLPTDEEGNIDLPNLNNGDLEEYLTYRVKRNVAERLMGNNDAPQSLANLYNIYSERERQTLRSASNAIKMSKLTPNSLKRLSRLNKLESLQYESPFTRR